MIAESGRTQPTIIVDKSLEKDDIPYGVSFNTPRYAELLNHLGMPDEAIANQKVILQRKPRGAARLWSFLGTLKGSTDNSGNITIYTDPDWDSYRNLREANADALSEANLSLHTVLFHETQHAVDRHINKVVAAEGIALGSLTGCTSFLLWSFIVGDRVWTRIEHSTDPIYTGVQIGLSVATLAGFMIGAQQIAYTINPMERRARKTQAEYGLQSKWNSILNLSPKENIN